VSPLYLYAIVGTGFPVEGAGLAGEPLRLIGEGPVRGVAGSLPEKPQPIPSALAAHDAVVRRLADQITALLPARFGQTLPDEQALTDWLAAHAPELAEALVQVAGCVQMTLRVYGEGPAAHPDDLSELPAGGPGTRYLEQRRREAERERSLPDIAPLREALRPLLKAERIERPATPAGRLRATAYDLIARGASDDYARIVAATSLDCQRDGWHVSASGPWPPYAFAPGPVR